FQKSESQPLCSSRSLLAMARTRGRQTTGITTTFWMARSFILMYMPPRLTGSSSPSAALYSLSASSFRQRVMLRPCHLFSFEETSHDVNAIMNSSGSGWVMVVVYIWMSVEKCGYVSRLAGWEEKYTEAVIDLISMSS